MFFHLYLAILAPNRAILAENRPILAQKEVFYGNLGHLFVMKYHAFLSIISPKYLILA